LVDLQDFAPFSIFTAKAHYPSKARGRQGRPPMDPSQMPFPAAGASWTSTKGKPATVRPKSARDWFGLRCPICTRSLIQNEFSTRLRQGNRARAKPPERSAQGRYAFAAR
jgi:hypothetical protein